MNENLPTGTELLRRARAFSDASKALVESLTALCMALQPLSSTSPLPNLVYLAIIDTRLALLANLREYRDALQMCLKLTTLIGLLRTQPSMDAGQLWPPILEDVNKLKALAFRQQKATRAFRESWVKLRAGRLAMSSATAQPQAAYVSIISRIFNWIRETPDVSTETITPMESLREPLTAVDKALGPFEDCFRHFAQFWDLWDIPVLSPTRSIGSMDTSSTVREMIETWDIEGSLRGHSATLLGIQALLISAPPGLVPEAV